jgi:hypothetical protein
MRWLLFDEPLATVVPESFNPAFAHRSSVPSCAKATSLITPSSAERVDMVDPNHLCGFPAPGYRGRAKQRVVIGFEFAFSAYAIL